MILDCAGKTLNLSRPVVMGILNVTPDSFSDGGRFFDRERALEAAHRMAAEGAAIIDVGGESTRPGAAPVSVQEELERVIPVVEALSEELPLVISVDTSKPVVMRAAVAAGAGFINDVYALRAEGALAVAADSGAAICLMHMQGEPRTMQKSPVYHDVVSEVRDFLAGRVEACKASGIPTNRLVVDPGFGFGKTVQHNLSLLKHLDAFASLDLPVLVGLSRKSLIGAILDAPIEERAHGSLALAALGAWLGASIVRVHDVKATVEALKLVDAVYTAA